MTASSPARSNSPHPPPHADERARLTSPPALAPVRKTTSAGEREKSPDIAGGVSGNQLTTPGNVAGPCGETRDTPAKAQVTSVDGNGTASVTVHFTADRATACDVFAQLRGNE